MEVINILTYLSGLCIIFVLCRIFSLPLKLIAKLFLNSLIGCVIILIINSIGKLPLRNLDRSELELYCTWYSIYKEASVQLNKEQSKKRKNIAKINNAIKTIDKATRAIKGLASDLGLNVNSRLQMNMPQTDKEEHQSLRDKFRIS